MKNKKATETVYTISELYTITEESSFLLKTDFYFLLSFQRAFVFSKNNLHICKQMKTSSGTFS